MSVNAAETAKLRDEYMALVKTKEEEVKTFSTTDKPLTTKSGLITAVKFAVSGMQTSGNIDVKQLCSGREDFINSYKTFVLKNKWAEEKDLKLWLKLTLLLLNAAIDKKRSEFDALCAKKVGWAERHPLVTFVGTILDLFLKTIPALSIGKDFINLFTLIDIINMTPGKEILVKYNPDNKIYKVLEIINYYDPDKLVPKIIRIERLPIYQTNVGRAARGNNPNMEREVSLNDICEPTSADMQPIVERREAKAAANAAARAAANAAARAAANNAAKSKTLKAAPVNIAKLKANLMTKKNKAVALREKAAAMKKSLEEAKATKMQTLVAAREKAAEAAAAARAANKNWVEAEAEQEEELREFAAANPLPASPINSNYGSNSEESYSPIPWPTRNENNITKPNPNKVRLLATLKGPRGGANRTATRRTRRNRS